MATSSQYGRILDIQRFSTEDGPGIRSTVFLQGCVLKCKWCQNPESWAPISQLVWYDNRCMAARHCLDICPEQALQLTENGMQIDRTVCNGCGKCIEVCPTKALEILGKKMTVEEVVTQVLRDKAFYEESNGGVTLSGGDPLFQPSFSLAILQALKKNNIHTAIDTTGYAKQEIFAKLVTNCDLVLLDLKQMDPDLHQKITEVNLEKILNNAKWLGRQNKNVWIRTPIIPTYTDQEANIRAIASFIKEHMANVVKRWDLLCYNNLSLSKWKRLDLDYELETLPQVREEKIKELAEIAKTSTLLVTWSGVVQKST
ncbi:MAG: glycyl-radical enzyme activating protein [Promethearchaeota archaeon]